jgi:hypothetical protein
MVINCIICAIRVFAPRPRQAKKLKMTGHGARYFSKKNVGREVNFFIKLRPAAPANKRVFASCPHNFNYFLILDFSLSGVAGRKHGWHKSTTLV